MIPEKFISRFMPVAEKVSDETGIPVLAMLAQSALETGWGTKVKGNNYFGIKGRGQLIRTKEIFETNKHVFPYIHSIKKLPNGKFEYDITTWFHTYNSPIDSFRSYAEFIKSNKRYKEALKQSTAKDFLIEVADAGYATSEKYKETVLNVLQSIIKRL